MTEWDDVMVPAYGTPGLTLAHGKGTTLTDTNGNSYTDLVGGIAVSALGHGHPALSDAVAQQVAKLAHTSNLYAHEPGLTLAARLHKATGGHRVFFTNSGTEANEAALKAMRRHAHAEGMPEGVVVAFENAFHGRTYGSLSLTPKPSHREGFAPLVPQIVHVPFNDPAALEAVFEAHKVAGVFVECIQGEGGILPMAAGFGQELQRITRANGAVLCVDEIQTGIGRTGRFFAYEHHDLKPDIVTVAKALAGGMPLGACLMAPKVSALFGPGAHGTTFGGNPVACAAANAVLDTIERDDLLAHVARLGSRARAIFDEARGASAPARGQGLLWGVPVAEGTAGKVVKAAQAQGLLVGNAGLDTLRLAPPLVIDEGTWVDALDTVAGLARAPPEPAPTPA